MNKTILILMVVALFSISLVSATPASCSDMGYDWELDGNVGSIDNECQNAGYDFGIAKWEYDDGFTKVDEISGYTTLVTGDDTEADWTSAPAADGILSKEGQCYQGLPGGSSGTVNNLARGISHITFCGNDGGDNEVPEFGVFGFIAVALAGAGILIFKRK